MTGLLRFKWVRKIASLLIGVFDEEGLRYYLISMVIGFFAIIMFLFSCFSTFTIFINQPTIKLQFDKNGYENFYAIYSFPIKMAVATFAIMATWLTLRRMIQTERQLEIISDNNRFNNYYKHIEEFLKYMVKSEFIGRISSVSPFNFQKTLILVYQSFYYKNYRNFSPSINFEKYISINKFLSLLKYSIYCIKDMDFHQIPLFQLSTLDIPIDPCILDLIIPLVEYDCKNIDNLLISRQSPEESRTVEVEKFKAIITYLYAESFYSDILAFDGKDYIRSQTFLENYELYKAKLINA